KGLLDRTRWTSTAVEGEGSAEGAPRHKGARVPDWLRAAWQFFVALTFSSVTRRIVSLNVAGLVALVIGVLLLSQFRAGLIDARIQTLLTQGEMIAGAIASSAAIDSDSSVT